MTEIILTEPEVRVLGSLIEKEITTPEYYPLSLNALMNACNQKTNREPVVSYNECTVTKALEDLLEKDLVLLIRDGRVPKYDNYFSDKLDLTPAQNAVMCILMLRGPQTPGEIRGRTERMYEFAELSDVEEVLDSLAAREQGAMVAKLPLQPGRKESRYTHLLTGDVEVETVSGACTENERISYLEAEVSSLRAELDDIRREFTEFRKQFE